jgi:hypothetical protein
MHRDTHFPLSMVRDTLEYAEARTLLAQKASLKRYLRSLNIELKLLRRLSPEAVDLAEMDVGEQQETGGGA